MDSYTYGTTSFARTLNRFAFSFAVAAATFGVYFYIGVTCNNGIQIQTIIMIFASRGIAHFKKIEY